MRHSLLITLFTFLFITSSSIAETIIRRNGLSQVTGTILSGGKGGLLIRVEGEQGASVQLPWSSISKILPQKPRPQLEPYLQSGDQLWRAKSRLLRGDVSLSEPIFALQFKELAGTDSEDSRLAAEGYLRALISRGSIERAIHPWIETVRLEEVGFTSQFTELSPILDEQTMIVVDLPLLAVDPIPIDVISPYIAPENPNTTALVKAILLESTTTPFLESSDTLNTDFLTLLLQTKQGNSESASQLHHALPTYEPWQQTWANYTLGIALLDKNTADSRNKALLHLAKVASLHPEDQPWLTAAAMLKLSEELEDDGFFDQSERIAFEAKQLYPSHPLVLQLIEEERNFIQ